MRRRNVPMTAVASIAAGLSALALSLIVGPAGAGTTAAQPAWKGTVTIVDDATHTFERTLDGVTGKWSLAYRDKATYVLTGETAAGGLQVAEMTGAGNGRLTGSQPPGCKPSYSPFLQWSYRGRALVKVTYANGRWTVAPRAVSVELRSARRGCSGRVEYTTKSVKPAPYGIDQIRPRGQKAPASAQALSGSERLPISFTIVRIAERAGTATLAWKLRRSA